MDILETIEQNPGVFLILLSIVGFIWAITGGGLKTKWLTLPVIVNTPRKITYVISSVILLVGIIIHFTNKPSPPDEPPPGILTDTIISPPVEPVVEVKYTLTGTLMDVFGNKLTDEIVKIEIGNIDIDSTLTNNSGSFEFDDLPGNGIYSISFLDTSKKLDFRKDNPIPVKLLYKPYTGFKATLCRDFIWEEGSKKPVKPFRNDENIVILFDSLLSHPDEAPHLLGCFIQLWGDANYDEGKDIEIVLNWYFDGEPNGNVSLSAGMNKFHHGWRTRGIKRVWKGNWELRVQTKSGYTIQKIIFNII